MNSTRVAKLTLARVASGTIEVRPRTYFEEQSCRVMDRIAAAMADVDPPLKPLIPEDRGVDLDAYFNFVPFAEAMIRRLCAGASR